MIGVDAGMAETKLLVSVAAARSGGYARGRAAAAAPCLGHQPRGDELPISHLALDTRFDRYRLALGLWL